MTRVHNPEGHVQCKESMWRPTRLQTTKETCTNLFLFWFWRMLPRLHPRSLLQQIACMLKHFEWHFLWASTACNSPWSSPALVQKATHGEKMPLPIPCLKCVELPVLLDLVQVTPWESQQQPHCMKSKFLKNFYRRGQDIGACALWGSIKLWMYTNKKHCQGSWLGPNDRSKMRCQLNTLASKWKVKVV